MNTTIQRQPGEIWPGSPITAVGIDYPGGPHGPLGFTLRGPRGVVVLFEPTAAQLLALFAPYLDDLLLHFSMKRPDYTEPTPRLAIDRLIFAIARACGEVEALAGGLAERD